MESTPRSTRGDGWADHTKEQSEKSLSRKWIVNTVKEQDRDKGHRVVGASERLNSRASLSLGPPILFMQWNMGVLYAPSSRLPIFSFEFCLLFSYSPLSNRMKKVYFSKSRSNQWFHRGDSHLSSFLSKEKKGRLLSTSERGESPQDGASYKGGKSSLPFPPLPDQTRPRISVSCFFRGRGLPFPK